MSIIRKTIKISDQNQTIKIPLESNGEFTGYQQEIDNYTVIQSENSINGGTDGEMIRLKYNPSLVDTQMNFRFWNYNENVWWRTYNIIGFDTDDIKNSSPDFLNSFFVLDIYDSNSSQKQVKIATAYITKLYYGYTDGEGNISSIFYIKPNFEMFYLNLPIEYFYNSPSTVLYGKFSFYNASTGKMQLFFNRTYSNSLTNKMYFIIRFNRSAKSWYFSSLYAGQVDALEMVTSPDYVDKINNTFTNTPNLRQSYPTGNTFSIIDGKYITT